MARAAALQQSPSSRAPTRRTRDAAAEARAALAWLERRGSARNRDGMARYGIRALRVFGVSMATMQSLAERIGRDHDVALALWDTGWYEARILAALVGDPARLTAAEMERFCRDFDNWAVCDTVCLHLCDRSPHAWRKVGPWTRRRGEFQRRAGFALLAALALHDKQAADGAFLRALPLIRQAATDDRNFVKKGVSWALRAIGHRNLALHAAAVDLATTLARSDDGTTRWVGKDVLRDLTRPVIRARLEARARGRARP